MLKQVKKMLGRDCTYLSFSQEKLFDNEKEEWCSFNCAKVKFKGQTVVIPLYKSVNDMTQTDYFTLFTIIAEERWKITTQKQE